MASDISISFGDGPSQPIIQSYKKIKKDNGKSYSFQASWYNKWNWIEYSIEQNGIFCFCCRHFAPHATSAINPVPVPAAFVTKGYDNFQYATGKKGALEVHAKSQKHIAASQAWKLRTSKTPSVAAMLSASYSKEVEINRHYIKTVGEVVLHLANQEMAFRGNNEQQWEWQDPLSTSNGGKFLATMKLIALHDDKIAKRLETGPSNATYLSPEIQNEVIGTLAAMVRDDIRMSLKNTPYITVLADETKDASKKEQLAVVIRYLENCKPVERFIAFVHAKEVNAVSLKAYIMDTLQNMGIERKGVVGQCYDGASVMSGVNAGVQALVRKDCPYAVYIHCFAHRLNLVLCDTCKVVLLAEDILSLLQELYCFMSGSVPNAIYSATSNITIKKLCETRWSSRYDSLKAVKSSYGNILNTLEECGKHDDSTRSAKAKGLLVQVKSFQFIVGLCILEKVFQRVNLASKALQDPGLDISGAIAIIQITRERLMELKEQEAWDDIYTDASKLANDASISTVPPENRRRRQVPQWLEDYYFSIGQRTEARVMNPSPEYKNELLLPVVDSMIKEIDDRFSDTSADVFDGALSFSPTSSTFLCSAKLLKMGLHYELCSTSDASDLEEECLHAKRILSDPLHTVNTSIDVLSILSSFQSTYSILVKLCRIAVVLPVLSSTCERMMSCLKRVKSYLRCSMGESRLSDLCLLSTDNYRIDLDEFVTRFSNNHKNRRIRLN